MPLPAKYLQPVHFEDFDGLQFERLAQADGAITDKDALALMAKLFDRPAFYTPSLPLRRGAVEP